MALEWQLRRKKPWWMGRTPAKVAPEPGTPQFILWSAVPHVYHACRAHPQVICAARPSFEPQFYPIPGITSPSMEGGRSYLQNQFATLNAGTDMLDLTASELDNKCRVHGQWMADYVANNQFADGLLRGKGSHNEGAYGGAFHFTHLGTTNFKSSQATYSFTSLMQHPMDAAPRTSTLKISAGSSRSITLPKRTDVQAGVPIAGTTQAVLDAIEALDNNTAGVRHVGYYTMRTANARAIIATVVRYFAERLKQRLDAYVIPAGFSGAGTTVQLCYPKLVPLSIEQFGYSGIMPSQRQIPAGADVPSMFWEVQGSFWHDRGDPASPRTEFTTEPIFRRKSDGRMMSFRDAILDDPILKASGWESKYAPALASVMAPTANENYAFRRLEWQAADWAIEDSIMSILRQYFPEIESVNFDFVECRSATDPYTRVGGGLASAQLQSWLTHQGPTFYGRSSTAWASVRAIRDGVSRAVEAWDYENRAETLAVMDTINPLKSSIPFIFGLETQERLASGATTEWGGSEQFFDDVATITHEDRGVNHFVVYQGDLDRTYAGIAELSEELRS